MPVKFPSLVSCATPECGAVIEPGRGQCDDCLKGNVPRRYRGRRARFVTPPLTRLTRPQEVPDGQ